MMRSVLRPKEGEKSFARVASATIKRTLTQMDGTLQNVANNSSCQLNHTVSWVKRRRVVC